MVKAGHEDDRDRQDRPSVRSLFLLHQASAGFLEETGTRARAEAGELLFGTVDTWLIWRMTGGAAARHRRHQCRADDALRHPRRAAGRRTMCDMLDVPQAMLPEVLDCAADFGTTTPDLFGARDPHSGCRGRSAGRHRGSGLLSRRGMMKSTYGTGCFALLNTGDAPVRSENRLLTTIGYQLDGKPTYALEGSIFIAGAVVQWLRDGLKIIDDAPQTQAMAEASDAEQGLVLVPAFTGLGAPYWNPDCRGAVFGLDPQLRARTSWPAPPLKASAIRPATCWRRCGPMAPTLARVSCAWTAA